MTDMELAKETLNGGGLTFAAAKDGAVISSPERGIVPVLDLLDRFKNGMAGWSVADKVVGKAPAMIYSQLKPAEIYSHVMTKDAVGILTQAGINCTFDVEAEKIINRAGTDICPMEKVVADIDDPADAIDKLRSKVSNN